MGREASYWCKRRETSEIQAKAYSGQRGTRTRMRSIYTTLVYVHSCIRIPPRVLHFSALVVLCVCLSVYPSVPALAASASVETSKQRYSRVSLRLFLD